MRLLDHNQKSIWIQENVSTINATYKLINDILQALNNKRNCGGIFFYLEKTLDCVDHDILLNKMDYYGVLGVFCFINKIVLRKSLSKGQI
jgi:hypothetical protein